MTQTKKRRRAQKIRYVDGYTLRHTFSEFDIIESAFSCRSSDRLVFPRISRGETWVDMRFQNELPFLLRMHKLEKRYWYLSEDELRQTLQKLLCKKSRVSRSLVIVRSEMYKGLTIRYVRGDLVRLYIDPWFFLGGHDLVYPSYIPKGEIWIDALQDEREVPFTLFHEYVERVAMGHGLSYALAHNNATKQEIRYRREELYGDTPKPLAVEPFDQTAGLCGPASLKIDLSFFGLDYDERYLARLCRASQRIGTEHENLIGGACKIGARVFAKDQGSIHELRYFINQERLPVIVGWWSDTPDCEPGEDCGHFSVVHHITDSHVHLVDPESDSGFTAMTIGQFLSRWHDTDTAHDVPVDRWYMVPHFSGRKYEIIGGVNYRSDRKNVVVL